jgi:Fic family protein
MSQRLGFSWDTFQPPTAQVSQERAIFRAKRSLAELVYDMAALEGNPFTYPEVKTLIDGTTVGGRRVSDQEQVLNTAAAWKFLFELIAQDKFTLDKKTFCELHRILAYNETINPGSFRDGQVGIGGTNYKPPHPEQLPEIFDQGIVILQAISNAYERAFAFFLFGALHQFFWDGNKRTSRVMAAGELLKSGLDIANIPVTKQLEFNQKMVRFYDTKDGSEMMSFLTGCIII